MHLFLTHSHASQHTLVAYSTEDDALACPFFSQLDEASKRQVAWALTQAPATCLFLGFEPVEDWRLWLASHGVSTTALTVVALDTSSLDAAYTMSFQTGASLLTA